ncbi:MAG: type II secretion system protein [Candidatus Paceibacterota bacterium]|jgi:prepilin-type N-terminal cleavage/methylation domain-containing protein
MKKGFTLIELLVVIAIIGILSSVVLASLNSARSKGSDAAIKSNLANARAQAELYYDSNTSSYSGVCDTDLATTKSIESQIDGAKTASGITAATNVILATAGSGILATCHVAANGSAWAAEVPLKASTAGTPSMFCVDSAGNAITKATALGASATVCQ